MKKSQLILLTKSAANTVLTAIQNNQTPDVNSLMLYSDSLVRYVFYPLAMHTEGQSLENLLKQLHYNFVYKQGSMLPIIQEYITEINNFTIGIQDSEIVYEPPFNSPTFTNIVLS